LHQIYKILFFLIPPSLVFSIFIADFITVIFSIFFFHIVVFKKEYNLLKNDFFILGILISAYLIFLSLISDEPFFSLRSSLFYLRFILFALIMSYLLKKYTINNKIIFFSFLLIYCLIILDSFFQIIFGVNTLGYIYDGKHLKSFFENEKILGSYLIRTIPVFLGLYILISKKFKHIHIIYLVILILLLEIIILYTGERTAIALTFLFNVLLLSIIIKYSKILFIISLLLLTLTSSLLFLNKDFRLNIVERTINQIYTTDKKLNPKDIHFFSYEHEAHYITALKMFKNNIFFGVGPRMFRHKCSQAEYIVIITKTENSCSSHPHSLYLQILSETGIFIFILLLFGLSFVIYNIVKFLLFNSNYDNKKILFLICIFINIFPIIPYGNFFNNWLSIIFYLPIVFLIDINSFKISNFITTYTNKNILLK